MRRQPYTKTETRMVETMCEDGASPKAIAERIGRSDMSVERKIEKLRRAKKWTSRGRPVEGRA